MLSCSRQSLRSGDVDGDVLKSRCKSVSGFHRLRPTVSFRSAAPTEDEKDCAAGSAERRSVVSPLRVFARRRVTQHNSFNSYFRPAPVSRHRCPLTPPLCPQQSLNQASPSADQQPLPSWSHGDFVSSPPHRVYRKQIVHEMSSLKLTPSTRHRQDRPRSPPVSGSGRSGVAMRRRSVFGHVNSGAAGVLPARLGRRNTVAGGGVVECPPPPPPIPLSLREIYRLSRHGSVHNRHNSRGRRQSTFSMLRSDKESALPPSKTSVGVSRCESGRSRRLASSACERTSIGSGLHGDCDGDDDAFDVRGRYGYVDNVEQKHRLAPVQSSGNDDPQLPAPRNHDDVVRDTSKTHAFDIILVSLLECAFIIISHQPLRRVCLSVCLCVIKLCKQYVSKTI